MTHPNASAPDPETLLENAGLETTPNRVLVLRMLSSSGHPQSAAELLDQTRAVRAMNKVTLYRILDLFADKGIIRRHSAGDRSFRYCLASPCNHSAVCHFYCTRCSRVECLHPDETTWNQAFPRPELIGRVDIVEIRLDGICSDCLRQSE